MHLPIRLGLMTPLTGLVALYGPEISHAGRIACDEINQNGGILGRPLELIIVDDGSLPETAVPAAHALIDQHRCVAMIGNLLSNSRIAVASMVAEPRRIPYLNFSFYEGSISSRHFFHFAALPNQQIDRMIPFMAQEFGPKMFFAGSNYEWPRGSIDAARKVLARCGGEQVGEEYLEIGSSAIDELLGKVARSGADVFVPYFAGQDQITLLTRFTELGLKNRMAVVMGHYDEAMASQLPPTVREGFYSSNTYFMSLNNAANHACLRRLGAMEGIHGIWPHGNGIVTNFGEGTYVCVHAFAKAAQQAGSLESEALLAALRTVEVTAPQGNVRMDPATQHAHVNGYLSRCNVDGTFTIIERFGQIPPLIPERYRDVSFGSSSHGLAGQDAEERSHTKDNALRTPCAVAGFDWQGAIRFHNGRFADLWPEFSQGNDRSVRQLWHDPEAFDAALDVVRTQGDWHGSLLARTRNDEQNRFQSLLMERLPSEGNGPATCILYSRQEESEPLPAMDSASRILNMADMAVIATNAEGSIQQLNTRACDMFGYAQEELIGLSVHLLLPPHLRGHHVQAMKMFVDGPTSEILMGRRGAVSGYRKDGSVFPAEASISRFRHGQEWMLVVTLQDITERKRAEADMLWRATHDPLTSLPNRALIKERLHNALQRTRHNGLNVALLFVDLDNFKLINDTYGHDAGDRLLIAVANILINNVRAGDTVARLGGDEFLILCDQTESLQPITMLAERLNQALRSPVSLGEHQVFITASIGLAIGHGATHSADDLLRESDAAMYSSKEQGRDGYRIFSPEVQALVQQRLTISNGLRHALERDEFSLLFQPIVSADQGDICGAEALIRWQNASGPVSPGVFIPIAESTGSIIPIGAWVFRHACRAQTGWRRALVGQDPPYVSINVSTRQLNESTLVDAFAAILREEETQPAHVLIEITETSLMSDVELNLKALRGLSELGLKIAVDDFGTGYSSLLQLLRMPVATIKIDRAFVDGLDKREDSRAITAAIVRMSKSLGKDVIAEGVENGVQQLKLQHLGADRLQGFFFFRPMSNEALLDAVRAQNIRMLDRRDAPVFYLIYLSKAVIEVTETFLEELQRHAQAFNGTHGITGFLIYTNGCFMQMLEGRMEVVNDLMSRIACDPRHHQLQIVVSGQAEQRMFRDWNMGVWNMDLVSSRVDFSMWQQKEINLLELSANPRLCLALFDALSQHNLSKSNGM
ncbi:MAG: ABC transporter substrate-binding protein [Magnetococcales bacterium]|nr:ABC transporter substrate-binding protein [Magnetococcales bacterium]